MDDFLEHRFIKIMLAAKGKEGGSCIHRLENSRSTQILGYQTPRLKYASQSGESGVLDLT